jgi:uncharacterized protein YkwD
MMLHQSNSDSSPLTRIEGRPAAHRLTLAKFSEKQIGIRSSYSRASSNTTLSQFVPGGVERTQSKRLNRFVRQVLRLTNLERRRVGLNPLRLHPKLGKAAQAHSRDMGSRDFFSHTGSNGSSLGDRIRRVGYRYSYAAENIAASASSPQQVVNLWMNSPGHRANILTPKLKHIGIGYYYVSNDAGNEQWGHYWTQKFGTPLR